jgi:hypothetical protein
MIRDTPSSNRRVLKIELNARRPSALFKLVLVLLQLMGLQVNVRLKNHKLFLQTLSLCADPVLFLEVLVQERIVFKVHVLMESQPFANETRLMGLSAVEKELVFGVEMNATEATGRMAFE